MDTLSRNAVRGLGASSRTRFAGALLFQPSRAREAIFAFGLPARYRLAKCSP